EGECERGCNRPRPPDRREWRTCPCDASTRHGAAAGAAWPRPPLPRRRGRPGGDRWAGGMERKRAAGPGLRGRTREFLAIEETLRQGGGNSAIARQHEKGRMTARERIAALLDPDSELFELGLWAAFQMYDEWGGAPGAGVVTGIGVVAGRRVMI